MLVYDYVELNEKMFNHITEDVKPYKTEDLSLVVKTYYNCFNTTVIKMYHEDINLTQYFIYSTHPV